MSVLLPFTCVEKPFHSCEIKTVWTFPSGPKEVKGFGSAGFVAHPRWDIWPRVDLSLYSHALPMHNVIQQQYYNTQPFRLPSEAQIHANENTLSFQSCVLSSTHTVYHITGKLLQSSFTENCDVNVYNILIPYSPIQQIGAGYTVIYCSYITPHK